MTPQPHLLPTDAPLVSVVMPAFKSLYLKQALASLAAQTCRAIELIVCDDNPGTAVRDCVQAFAATAPFPVQYHHNPERLRESRNAARCVSLARGQFIKFLYDDDVLEAACIAAQAAVLRAHPDIALVTSRRRRIGPAGEILPDTLHTAPLFTGDVRIDGRALVRFLGAHPHNFIGEPSAVMCRRADLADCGERLMDLAGQPIQWFGDLALYARLLQRGDLAYLAARLSDFRVSPWQFSQLGRERPGIGERGRDAFRNGLRQLGWADPEGFDTPTTVPLAPLDAGAPAQPLDLLQALAEAETRAGVRAQLDEWQQQRRLDPSQWPLAQAWLDAHARPALTVLLDARHRDDAALQATLESLAEQRSLYAPLHVRVLGRGEIAADYRDWVANAPAAPDLGAAFAALRADSLPGTWLVQADAGDVFCAGALQRLPLALAAANAPHAVFADEWHRGPGLAPPAPVLRPDFDPDLLLGHPAAMAGHWIFAREALDALDVPAGDDPLVLSLALILQLLERGGSDHLAHLPEPLLYCEPPRSDATRLAALTADHLHRLGHPDTAISSPAPGLQRIDWRHDRSARVSLVLVVDAATDAANLQRCVVSLLEKTGHPDYELLLADNGAVPEVSQWLQQVTALAPSRLRLFGFDAVVPHAQASNLAASQASGEFLLFLRAEAAFVQPHWLQAMLAHGLREGVGITGARTVSAEGRITHAGLLPALAGESIGAFVGEPIDAPGYLGRLRLAHACQAVSDRCLLVGRGLFEQLGGFDAEAFPQDGADIDLCLRGQALGQRVVWTPDALLLHAGPPTLSEASRQRLLERWLPDIAQSPAYHPGLRLDVPGGYRLGESAFSWQPLPHRPQPRVLAHPADAHGSGQYRVLQPLAALRAAGAVEGTAHALLLDTVEQHRIDPDVVILQRRVGEAELARMAAMPRHSNALKVYELDDYLLELPAGSLHRAQLPADIGRSLPRALSLCDRVVVSTPALAEALSGLHADIRVARNRLPPAWWTRLPQVHRNTGPRPRVGWAGGIGHGGDLEMMFEVVRALAGEVDWVFMGMCPERLRPYVREFHAGVDIEVYPRALARLNLDLALAPLEDNRFNACKSNLRLLEYGACAFPVVCSDVEAYRDGLPVTRVRNRSADWLAAIREHLADGDARAAAGDALRAVVRRDWMLEGDGLADWRAAWLP